MEAPPLRRSFADAPVEGVADGAPLAKVPEWVMVLPAPDGDGKIYSRDKRVLHIDSLEKLAARSNKALKKQKGGGRGARAWARGYCTQVRS